MDFGGGSATGGNNAGPDLEEVRTEQLAFQAISPDHTLRLLPSPWPSDNLPPNSASLLSVASSKGLVAAAGPDILVVARTETVRKAILENGSGDNGVKSFQPETTINAPRISQVSFSSDESCLVITAEQGGGLAVYTTDSITSGGKDAAFQLGTNGQGVRQISPNPNPSQDLSRFFAVVTTEGQLLLADLREQKLVNAASGSPVFFENVYCACWSRLGKQIIAGLRDGTAVQIDPQGSVKATIPEPPQLAAWKNSNSDANPLTSIYWLDTNDFLLIHTPVNSTDSMAEDDSIYHLARRERPNSQNWTFTKFTDPCPAFGADRKPAHHFLQRLREWPPDLSDMIILASTASSDLGCFTKSKAPLDSEQPVVDSWTLTMPPDDRRLAMPMSLDTGGDTSPIGMALDLSVKEMAPNPIPTDETMEQSPVELPALYVLDNEGRLSTWYIVYRPSVRQKTHYPDLIAANGPRPLGEQKQQTPTHAHPPAQQTPSTNAFANSSTAFGTSSMAFGKPSTQFGNTSSPSFGGASALGSNVSPWTSGAGSTTGMSTFGKPSFGATSSLGGGSTGRPTFGQPSFGTPSAPGSSGGFGGAGISGANFASSQGGQTQTNQATSGGGSTIFGGSLGQQSPFAAASQGNKPAASPFAAFASNSGSKPAPSPFGNVGGAAKETSIFGSKPNLSAEPSGSTVSFGTGSSFGAGSAFGSGGGTPTLFGQPDQTSASGSSFGKLSASGPEETMDSGDGNAAAKPGLSPFGSDTSTFKLGSTFKGDGSAKDDLPKPKDPGSGLFGNAFGNALSEPAERTQQPTTPIKEEPGTAQEPQLKDIPPASTTPVSPPKKEDKHPVDDAPLPPDFTTWKPKPGAPPAPIPPGFGTDFARPVPSPKVEQSIGATSHQDAPLPPDFTKPTEGPPKATERPLAGSPPVDLGGDGEKPAAGTADEEAGPPEEDGEEWSDEEGEDEDGDGEGEFEEEDEDEDEEEDEGEEEEDEQSPKIEDQKGLDSFMARLTPQTQRHETRQPESTTPATDKKSSFTPAGLPATEKKISFTPAGLPNGPVFSPPVRDANASPRSPSPIRNATSPVRLGTQSESQQRLQPQPHSQTSKPTPQKPSQIPHQPPAQSQRIVVPTAQLLQAERSQDPPEDPEPEVGQLEDAQDAYIQSVLKAPIEPTKELAPFLAHQDYVNNDAGAQSSSEKQGVGAQIERVYRDINSMVDTLALNARSVQAFVQGHAELKGDHDKDRDDLDNGDSWCLDDLGVLAKMIEDIGESLEEGRLEDVDGKVTLLQAEHEEMVKSKARGAEIRRQVTPHTDPEQLTLQAAAPLPVEAQAQQTELRQGVQKVQALLAKAEEQLSFLRADLASLAQTSVGRDGVANANVPTVEAVTNTILKMTAMIERKSGDIDVLEAQIRRLGGPAALHDPPSATDGNYEDELASALKASRLSYGSPAPAASASKMVRSGYGSLYESPTALAAARRGSPVMRKSKLGGDGLRRSLLNVPQAEIDVYARKKAVRRQVCEALREHVEARGVKVVKVRR